MDLNSPVWVHYRIELLGGHHPKNEPPATAHSEPIPGRRLLLWFSGSVLPLPSTPYSGDLRETPASFSELRPIARLLQPDLSPKFQWGRQPPLAPL